jgi:hypothetical protein
VRVETYYQIIFHGREKMNHLFKIVMLLTLVLAADAFAQLIPMHRFMGQNHLYTSNYNEGMQHGLRYEGAINLYQSGNHSNLAPLFRCYVANPRMVFVSRNYNCEGYYRQGVYGYVSNVQTGYELPLYRYYKINDPYMDHLVTTNPQAENLWGYAYEGILGYVPNY